MHGRIELSNDSMAVALMVPQENLSALFCLALINIITMQKHSIAILMNIIFKDSIQLFLLRFGLLTWWRG